MENSEESLTSGSENGGQRNSALELLSSLSDMINSASLRLSDNSPLGDSTVSESSAANTYDTTLAAKHEYLGNDLQDVRGRTILDEGSVVVMPILMELDVVLVPGQTLPLTVFYPHTVSMFRKIINKDKTFGVVSHAGKIGTTAEIFQYQEENDLVGLRIKARGRQRFKLLEKIRQTPGVLSGKVLILHEVNLPSPLFSSRFSSLNKYRHNSLMKNKLNCLDAVTTPWPSWVYKNYDPEHLSKKVIEEMKSLKPDFSKLSLSSDPVDFSYWITQGLPLDAVNRIKMLRFNTPIERFQYALKLLSRCEKFYCAFCGNSLANREDVFCMSIDGPQGMYCNPGGYVHEIVTVYKGSGMSLMQETPSTEYTWFPGYGWTTAQCVTCDGHMGWLFTAVKTGLKPAKFWGLSRKSVTINRKNLLRRVRSQNVNSN